MGCKRSYLRTCVASLLDSRALHDGPSATGSPLPRRWASGSPGSPSLHLEPRSHHGGNTGWWEAAEYAQEPVRKRKEKSIREICWISKECTWMCKTCVNQTFSKLCLREGHLFSHSIAASNTISSLGTLRKSLVRISVSLSTQRERNSSWWVNKNNGVNSVRCKWQPAHCLCARWR